MRGVRPRTAGPAANCDSTNPMVLCGPTVNGENGLVVITWNLGHRPATAPPS